MICCEKCGQPVRSLSNEYSSNYYTIELNYHGYFYDTTNSLGQRYDFDLCPKCAGELLEFVKNGKQ